MKSFIITTKSTEPEFDFLSRNFVPWAGIPEDAGKICSVASAEGSFQMKQVLCIFSDGVRAHSVGLALVRTTQQDRDAGETVLGEGRRLGFGVAHFCLKNTELATFCFKLGARGKPFKYRDT